MVALLKWLPVIFFLAAMLAISNMTLVHITMDQVYASFGSALIALFYGREKTNMLLRQDNNSNYSEMAL